MLHHLNSPKTEYQKVENLEKAFQENVGSSIVVQAYRPTSGFYDHASAFAHLVVLDFTTCFSCVFRQSESQSTSAMPEVNPNDYTHFVVLVAS